MEKTNKTIVMLKYSIDRYQQMGNGAKCQSLLSELNKLQSAKAQANA